MLMKIYVVYISFKEQNDKPLKMYICVAGFYVILSIRDNSIIISETIRIYFLTMSANPAIVFSSPVAVALWVAAGHDPGWFEAGRDGCALEFFNGDPGWLELVLDGDPEWFERMEDSLTDFASCSLGYPIFRVLVRRPKRRRTCWNSGSQRRSWYLHSPWCFAASDVMKMVTDTNTRTSLLIPIIGFICFSLFLVKTEYDGNTIYIGIRVDSRFKIQE